jgi:O-Antigen ligase
LCFSLTFVAGKALYDWRSPHRRFSNHSNVISVRASEIQSILPRLPLIITTAAMLVGALLIGEFIGKGEFMPVYLVVFGSAALAAVLAMGSKYWLLIPIAFSFNLPAIPLGGRAFELPELAIIACTAVFICRAALNPHGITLFRSAHLGVILYAAWAAIIFLMHPIGLAIMGSSTGGARFYFKIGLALASFLIVANQKITEGDAKWIIRLLIIGSIVGMTVNIAKYVIFGPPPAYTDPNASSDAYYTWQQAIATPALWIMLWLVARYKAKEILSLARPWAVPLFILCIAVAAVSGKRAGFASVLLVPVIAGLIRKEYFHVFGGMILAAAMIAFLVLGQGNLFRLPLQAQRTLSYLPGKWDLEVESEFQNGVDPFREDMRELAWEKIDKHPFIGQGYEVNMHALWGLLSQGDLHMFTIASLAIGSSWHNTWLGIWADFGLPAVLFWGIFWLQALVIGFWLYRRTPRGSHYRTLTFMILLWFIIAICRSWTSGHSANDAFQTWWMFAVLVSLRYVTRIGRAPQKKADPRLPAMVSISP